MQAVRRGAATASNSVLGASKRFASVDAKVVRYQRHGHAAANGVLKLETVRLDSAALKPTEVMVRMLAAPITPSDLSAIAGFGSSGKKAPAFPRAAGNEGVGVVEAAGSNASGLKKGDFVVASKAGLGTWATHVVSEADGWTALSSSSAVGSDSLPVEVAATAVAAPLVAKHLVSLYATKGSTLVQNLALSSVGQCVVQYAAMKGGVTTVNIARKSSDWDNKVYHLQGLGAGHVVDEAFAASTPKFHRLLADLSPVTVGLNGAGGSAASSVLKALANNATMVSYGSMSGQPVRVPADVFALRNITLKGFSLADTLAALGGKDKRDAAVREVVADVSGGEKDAKVRMLLAREPFNDFPHALARAMQSGERKVVLVMPK